MRPRNVLCAVLSCCLAGAAVACGGTEDPDGKPSGKQTLSLGVQLETLAEGECNAFVADAENIDGSVKLVYELSADDGGFETIKTTTERTVVYRFDNAGEYTVRVKTQDGKLVSDVCAFSVAEFGGDTFGRSPLGEMPTNNVRLDGDRGDSAFIEHKAVNTISDEYAFVKGFQADRFYFTADVDIVGTNSGDRNPKTGLFCKSGSTVYYFAFDIKPSLTGDELVFVKYTPTQNWGWPGKVMHKQVRFRDGETRLKNNMSMLRDRDKFYLFINGTCIGKAVVEGYTDLSTVGTYTMAQNTIYSGYNCYGADSEEFTAMLRVGQAAFD